MAGAKRKPAVPVPASAAKAPGIDTPQSELRALLDDRYVRYANPAFIADDPIAIPHSLVDPADREIIGFWVAMLAWGQRKTILDKGRILLALMEGEPARFIREHSERD